MSSTDSTSVISSNPWYLAKPTGSIYDGLTCLEYPNPEQVHGWVVNKMGAELRANQYKYPTQLAMMEKYEKLFNPHMGAFSTSHALPGHGWGRLEPNKHLSLSVMTRPARHGLATGIYDDLDIANCQPTILCEFMRRSGAKCTAIADYVANRNTHLDLFQSHYGCTRAMAKDLIIRLMNGGTYRQWVKDVQTDKPCLQCVTNIILELKPVADSIYNANPHIKADVLAVNPKKWRYDVDCKRGVVALFMQTQERILQEKAIQYLVDTHKIPLRDVIPCQDGLMILHAHYRDGMEAEINDHIANQCHIALNFVKKAFDEAIHIPAMAMDAVAMAPGRSFDEVAYEFEKEVCCIVRRGVFVCTGADGKVITMSPSHLKTAYENKTYDKMQKGKITTHNFIADWTTSNENRRQMMDMGVYPNPADCPKDYLNLWVPFAMENVHDYTPQPEALARILAHIRILCGNEETAYVYVRDWVGQMIQFPHIKTRMLIFIGEEGIGKTYFTLLLGLMLGSEKILSTATPDRDIWGHFNSAMAHSFLINLNELNKTSTVGAMDKIKQLITDEALTINDKGVRPYQLRSYHRFIATTNNEDPIPTSKKDRRNVIIRSSDELLDNSEYFREMHALLEDKNVIKTCYEYFANLPDLATFHSRPAPVTEYQEALKQLSYSPIEQFLQEYITYPMFDDNMHTPVNLRSSRMFEAYSSWCEKNHIQFIGSALKFGVTLKNKRIPGVEKGQLTNRGSTWDITKSKIMQYFAPKQNHSPVHVPAPEAVSPTIAPVHATRTPASKLVPHIISPKNTTDDSEDEDSDYEDPDPVRRGY